MTTVDRSDYSAWAYPSPLLDAIGSLRGHVSDPMRAGFVVDECKVNGRGILHGGVIATVGDVVIGHALRTLLPEPIPFVTINMNCDLLGVARLGDWVDVTVTPGRVGHRLAAGTATFATDRTIATVTALFMPAGAAGSPAAPRAEARSA